MPARARAAGGGGDDPASGRPAPRLAPMPSLQGVGPTGHPGKLPHVLPGMRRRQPSSQEGDGIAAGGVPRGESRAATYQDRPRAVAARRGRVGTCDLVDIQDRAYRSPRGHVDHLVSHEDLDETGHDEQPDPRRPVAGTTLSRRLTKSDPCPAVHNIQRMRRCMGLASANLPTTGRAYDPRSCAVVSTESLLTFDRMLALLTEACA